MAATPGPIRPRAGAGRRAIPIRVRELGGTPRALVAAGLRVTLVNPPVALDHTALPVVLRPCRPWIAFRSWMLRPRGRGATLPCGANPARPLDVGAVRTDMRLDCEEHRVMIKRLPGKKLTPAERKKIDERLDEQGEESFPASDPPAQPNIIGPHVEPPTREKPRR